MSRSRSWQFTLNSYTQSDEDAIQNLECRYLVYGREVAPTTGTHHLQGMICFDNQRAFSSVKKMIPGAHIEPTISQTALMKYNMKEGDFFEKGQRPITSKERGDNEKERWSIALAAAKSGRYDDVPPDIMIRYVGNLRKIHEMYLPTPVDRDVLDNEWFWGPSGSGKSSTARRENPGAYIKLKNKWWNRYTDHDVVIIEEWSPNDEFYMACYLKQWSDHYVFPAENKGGMIDIRPKKIIVTSNYSINECFSDPCNLEPIKRRFVERFFCK